MESFPTIVGLNSIAEAGFPDILCPAIFISGCNLRCPYCMNKNVVFGDTGLSYSVEEVVNYMKKNRQTDILISGGEPLANKNIVNLVHRLIENNVNVRLSTNGTFFDQLYSLVTNGELSFVALDIKTNVTNASESEVVYSESQLENVKKSIELLNTLAKPKTENFTFEFRTTLYPPLITNDSIVELSKIIDPDAVWYLQQFRLKKGLLGGKPAEDVSPYSEGELEEIIGLAKEKVPRACVRWP
jgi:pyruvate formate lyase activating enzyme